MTFDLFGKKTKFIDSGFCDPQYNMDYDLSLVNELEKNDFEAYFRIYAWKPYAISLGMNQDENEIDNIYLDKDNYHLVRRPTGGRAVFHANELTYSYITNLDKYSKSEIYELIHIEFEKVLKDINIDSDFVKSNSDFRGIYKGGESRSLCFASSAKYEIEIDGKKIIGSAQRVIDNKLLQHGSIPIDKSHLNIVNYINVENKEKLRKILEMKSTEISTHNRDITDYFDFAEVVKEHFNIK